MTRQDVTIRRAGSYQLMYSTEADRSDAVPLHGAVVSGVIYVFLSPTTAAASVDFWKPDALFRTDASAPFDLVGSVGANATALNVSDHWQDGPAQLHAVVHASDGTFTATAEFTASESVSPPTDATVPTEPGPVAATVSMAAPTVTVTGNVSVTPSAVSVSAAVARPGVSTGSTSINDAVGYFGGNARAGESNASVGVIEDFEAHVGRRIGFASSNFAVKCGLADLTGCSTSQSADTVRKDGHGLTVRDTVHMTSPTQAGISANTAYWVVNPTANTFQLSSSKNGSPRDITADVSNLNFKKHVFLGGATSQADNFYRPEWAMRPDVTHAAIFHMWQVAQVSGQQKSPPPAFRRSRRLEVIAGEWDAVYNALFNRFHRTKSGASYNASTGTITDAGHGHRVGERVVVTAQATTSAFTVSTEANPTYYYILSKTADTYTLTTTPPWDWDTENEVAVTGGGNGTISTVWRFNIQFRVGHEGDIPYSGGYPDGRLWPDVTADDEVKCRQSWEHLCDLIHSHGFKTVWGGDGNMFHKIYEAGNSSGAVMSGYKTDFPGDERDAWEYGLPGSSHSGAPNYTPDHSGVKATYDEDGVHTGGYIDYLDLDVYYGANGSGGKTSSASLAYIDDLIEAAGDLGVPWSIAELGIFLVSRVGPTNVSASAATDLFTASSGHGFTNNMPVVVGYAGTAPSPIKKNEGTVYYVDSVSATEFGLRASDGGARINLTSDGSGLSIKRWAKIPDTTSGSLMSAKDWLNAVFDKAAASGNCHYINYFWAGGDASETFFTRTNLRIWAPGAYQAVFGDRLAGA